VTGYGKVDVENKVNNPALVVRRRERQVVVAQHVKVDDDWQT